MLEHELYVLECKLDLSFNIILDHLEGLRVPAALTSAFDKPCAWNSNGLGVVKVADLLLADTWWVEVLERCHVVNWML
jgi:hypothetical protein